LYIECHLLGCYAIGLEECITSIIRVTAIGELGMTLAVIVTVNVVPKSSILVTLMMEAIHSSKMLVLTRIIHCNIPEDGILRSHHREHSNLSSVCIVNVPAEI
jgi:hypothetical protein